MVINHVSKCWDDPPPISATSAISTRYFPCVFVDFRPGEDCAGCDATFPKISVEQQQRLLMFFHPEPQMPSEAMAEIL